MRGDVNRDFYNGGTGSDTVSFATATPPGPSASVSGVFVDLQNERALENPAQRLVVDADPLGQGAEEVKSTENVIGSEFDDSARGIGGAVRGLGGSDDCAAFASTDCGGASSPPPGVTLEGFGGDPGLLIRGGPEAESISVAADATKFTVTSSQRLAAGAGCASASAGTVTCAAPAAPLGYAMAWSDGGDDQLSLGPGFPVTASVVLDGGEGSDAIDGSSGSEVLLAGPSGFDRLSAAGGDDALFSAMGADAMSGGDGNDQLVTSHPCEGHEMSGGKGRGDIAGFGQSIETGIVAQLGGVAFVPGATGCTPDERPRRQ